MTTIPAADRDPAAAPKRPPQVQVEGPSPSLSTSGRPPINTRAIKVPNVTKVEPAGDSKTKEKKAETAAPKKPVKKAEPAKPKNPSRHWVQVAGGANKNTLPREFSRLKEKAPKLLGSRTPYTTPLRATNRLLVGPFKSESEAQAFVNDLAKLDLSAFSWTSPEGQEIEKLSLK